ncbi:MAG: hypothetical protein J3Q66DRAFT_432918 [Benniella sp.]|nr:MAG: hypothetical protein J3Q66DRAFT_432918 [Benniella sp.]
MPRSLSPSPTSILLIFLLTFLLNSPFSPSVHAQLFRPIPDSGQCSGFTEGQGLYIVGGHGTVGNFTVQSFMLDLSVSWNTSDPVFRKIPGGPMMTGMTCTMANNGDDLFVLSRGTGYVYNVKSDSWSVFQNNMFPDDTERYVGNTIATDPATGFVYVFDFAAEFSGEDVVLAVDLRTKTVNSVKFPMMDFDNFELAAWSEHLKSMLVFPLVNNSPYTFTPSEIGKSMKGWGDFSILKQQTEEIVFWDCVAPAYGGKKMVLLGRNYITHNGVIYVLDVVKRTWKGAPVTGHLGSGACAVTGDQFIVWGGDDGSKQSNETRVFNLKTGKWVKNYIAPPRPTTTSPTTISPTSQLPQTPTQHTPYASTNPDLGDTSSNEKKLVTIIIIVTGALLAIILTAISVYIGISSRMEIGIQGHTNPSGTALFRGAFGRRDPSGFGSNPTGISSDPDTRCKWYRPSLLSWLYRDLNGMRPPPEHPHAIVDQEKRNIQEDAVEVHFPAQHPHATVDQGSATKHNDKAEWESIRSHDGKEELVVK